MKSEETILIVDDEKNILRSLRGILEDEGYRVEEAESGEEALHTVSRGVADLVLLDIWLPDLDGIEVLKQIKEKREDLPVVMMSGHGTIEVAVKSTKIGAYDFIEKPLGMEKTVLTLRNALNQHKLERENRGLREILERKYRIVGESPAIVGLMKQLEVAAPSNGRVLIFGENGTGKELVARTIHLKSRRFNGPFVEVNCAAIPEELIESELFGHEKGAFTGAVSQKQGKFELAHEGTLFLDEVGDMSLKTQAKVLRALEEQAFNRVGGTKTINVDVRLIAASNKDLEEEIRLGKFREDLFYRLNVIPISMPPLRERREDIPHLVDHFVDAYAAEHGLRKKVVTKKALDALISYHWPGNVRELKNMIERLVIMSGEGKITRDDIPAPVRKDPSEYQIAEKNDLSLRSARLNFERDHIREILKRNNGNISRTARALGIERSNLHRKIRQLNIK
jgi:two-component system nitrogen regulation response regulator NtrX